MVYGDRSAAIANDLTKMFEKVERGMLSTLLTQIAQSKPKGEYIIVIAGAEKDTSSAKNLAEDLEDIVDGPEE